MKKRWLVHSYNNQSQFVTHAKARRLLAKFGGSYDWQENVCHVYILPTTTTTFSHSGQDELNAWVKFQQIRKNLGMEAAR